MRTTRMAMVGHVERAIRIMRGARVLLDADLAILYAVEVKALNQAVKRNQRRFPADFVFRMSADEVAALSHNL